MSLQTNKVTQVAYKGGNQDTLAEVKRIEGFKSNEWLTFLQAKSLNLKVKKGSKGVRLMTVTEEEIAVEGGKNQVKRGGIYFSVFNLDQTEEMKSE